MFNLGALASSVLDSIDNVAKETLEEPKVSAKVLRAKRKSEQTQITSSALSQLAEAPVDGSSSLAGSVRESGSDRHSVRSNTVVSDGATHVPQSIVTDNTVEEPNIDEEEDEETVQAGSKPSLSFGLSAISLPLSASTNNISSSSVGDGNDQALKQLIRKKAKEIETLNEECLELENQVNSLKIEVQEAWDHYKMSQEKAAFREAELLDEMSQIKKSKETDKQHAVQQIAKMQEEITALTKQVHDGQEEKRTLKSKVDEFDAMNSKWEEKVQRLQDELQEARLSTIQGAQSVREELRAAQAQMEQMRIDHANILRKSQGRQQNLEQENQELVQSINESQKELTRMKNLVQHLQNQQALNGDAVSTPHSEMSTTSGDFVTIQRELFTVAKQLEKEQAQLEDKDRELRKLERDYKTLQALYEDEKRSNVEQSTRSNDVIRSLREQLNSSSPSVGEENKTKAMVEELKKQVENLNHTLLKKQASMLELQAERSSLKSRVSDLQTKCTNLEHQLTAARDLEGGGAFDDDDFVNHALMGRNSEGLTRKRGSDPGFRGANRVLNDLERMGVKPGARVTKAVNVIDSWTLFAGSILRHNPLVRLGFVFYFLILHLWVFFILIIQTHTLDMSPGIDPQEKLLNEFVNN